MLAITCILYTPNLESYTRNPEMHVTAGRDLPGGLVYIDFVCLYDHGGTSSFCVRVDSHADFPLEMNDRGIPSFLDLLRLYPDDALVHRHVNVFHLGWVASVGALRTCGLTNERHHRYG